MHSRKLGIRLLALVSATVLVDGAAVSTTAAAKPPSTSTATLQATGCAAIANVFKSYSSTNPTGKTHSVCLDFATNAML